MLATILIVFIIAIWFGLGIRKIVSNIKSGKGIDGCSMDCSKCNLHCNSNNNLNNNSNSNSDFHDK